MPTQPQPAIKPFVASRVFDAPRERVFAAFTEPKRMAAWWGPAGCKVISQAMDLRPGGTYHYGLEMPGGAQMWGKFIYRDIVRPDKIVLVNCFSDATGGVTRHPMAPTWPLENLSTFLFEDDGPAPHGKTKVTIHWEPINASDTEIATFNAAHASMASGWSGTFDQLRDYLIADKS